MCESIIRHNALQKRKVYLDSIAQGLDEFGILSAMKFFPDLFSALFIPSTQVVAKDILGLIRFPEKMNEEEQVVFGFLKECVEQLSQQGIIGSYMHAHVHAHMINSILRPQSLCHLL